MGVSFKNEEDRRHYVKHTRIRSVHKGNSQPGENEMYNKAIQTIHSVQSALSDTLFGGYIGIELIVEGKTKADIDNVFKGVADSLQGVLYENDKQVKKGKFEHKDY
jgi:Holliday junction resolvase RusA-like endonuclease